MGDKKNKKITINDIALEAGVSKTTVSRFINGKFNEMSAETRSKIEKVINNNNYIPSNMARSLRTKSSKLIALVVSDVTVPYFTDVLKAMLDIVLETRYHIIVWSSNNSIIQERLLIESLLVQNVDAIVLNPVSFNSDHLKDLNINIPVILVNRTMKDFNYDLVKINKEDSFSSLFSYARKQGYKDFYYLIEDHSNNETRLKMVNQFKKFLFDNNIYDFDNRIKVIPNNDTMLLNNVLYDISKNMRDNSIIFANNGHLLMMSS